MLTDPTKLLINVAKSVDTKLSKLDRHAVCLVILAFLGGLQLLLYWRYTHELTQVLIQSIFVIALLRQVYQKQGKFIFVKDLPGNLLGIILILLLLVRARYIFFVEASVFWYAFAWFTLIGYILLIGGTKGVKKFDREIIIYFAITLTPVLLQFITYKLQDLPVTVISAKLSSFLLWYMGFNSSTQGQMVYVNGGGIDIYMGCTGVPLFLELLRFSFLTTLVFRSLCRNLWLPFLLPLIISIPVSTVRLVIMALVVKDVSALKFWHGVQGGNLFVTFSMITFFGIILLTAPAQNNIQDNIQGDLPRCQPRTPLWLLLSSSVALILIFFSFIHTKSPIAGANTFPPYQFPSTFNLPGWQLQDTKSQPLIPVVKDDDPPPGENNSDLPLSQRSYLYTNGDHQLMVDLRYIVNTFGEISGYYSSFQNLPKLDNSTQVIIKNDDNYHIQSQGEGRKYWMACLNVEGKTTVTSSQFVSYFRRGYVEPTKLLDWVIGKRVLQDRRCLWIELSVPRESSLTDSEVMDIWQVIVNYWRSHFPPLRS